MSSPGAFRDMPTGVDITLTVVTRAGRDEIVGIVGDAIKVRLTSPPVEGQANEALLRFLAKRLGVPLSALVLRRGARSHRKTVHVTGLRADAAEERLLAP